MFGTGRERVVTVTNGGQNTSDGQPLGFTFPYLINSVFHLEKGTFMKYFVGMMLSICLSIFYRYQISKLDCYKNNL